MLFLCISVVNKTPQESITYRLEGGEPFGYWKQFYNCEERRPHKLKYLRKLRNHFESVLVFLIFDAKRSDL